MYIIVTLLNLICIVLIIYFEPKSTNKIPELNNYGEVFKGIIMLLLIFIPVFDVLTLIILGYKLHDILNGIEIDG